MKIYLLALAIAAFPVSALAAEPLADLAERVGAAARRARVTRVSVLPLTSRSGAAARDGEVLADMLTERLVQEGRVRVVERSRLSDVMAERRLGSLAAGGADAASPRLAAAEAVVTGSFAQMDGKMKASVRLVHAETGEILAAAEETMAWGEPADGVHGDGSWSLEVPAPEFLADVPPIVMDPVELRDAPNDDTCADAAARVDRIAAGILDVKARYWAAELRKGYSPYAVTRNPGSEISDPELKARFYDAMKAWFQKSFVPELSRSEFEKMRREDARAAEIIGRCGL